jgi:integrase/recombinase XerC
MVGRPPAAPLSTGCATPSPPSSNADVSVYTLMKLLGHESMVTSQRYVTAAGAETRTAAAQNRLYALIQQQR